VNFPSSFGVLSQGVGFAALLPLLLLLLSLSLSLSQVAMVGLEELRCDE
jgi:hypothetical protein